MRIFKTLNLSGATLFAVLAAACGSDDPHTVTIDWQVTYFEDKTVDFPPVEGAKVCVDDHPEIECAITDSSGLFTLTGLPAKSDVLLTVNTEGYLPTIKLFHTEATSRVLPQALVVLREDQLPADQGPIDLEEAGVLSFFVFDFPVGESTPRNLAGVSVTLSPETEVTPIYLDKYGKPDPRFAGTLADDVFFTGGIFLNVPPGDYEVIFTPPEGYACRELGFNAWGVPVLGKQAVRATVRAGYSSADVAMNCTR